MKLTEHTKERQDGTNSERTRVIDGNLAQIGDIVECASITEFKVNRVKRCRVTKEWLYSLENTKSKMVKTHIPEANLSKINGVVL